MWGGLLTSPMRGDSQLSMAFIGAAQSFIQSRKLRSLATATPQRNPALPDAPTFAESGMPQYQYDAWFGVLAPANTPAPIIKKINEGIAAILTDPDEQARWQALGAIPVEKTSEQFDATIRFDADRYGKLLRAAGVAAN